MEAKDIKDRPGHYLFWLVGIVVATGPFIVVLIQPAWRAPWLLGPGRFADNLVLVGSSLLLGIALGGWLWFLLNQVRAKPMIQKWWHDKAPLNWIWFLVSFLIYAAHNIVVLTTYPFGSGEIFFASVGRVLTTLIVLALFWLVTSLASFASPSRLRLIPWTFMAIYPGILAADAFCILLWKHTLRFIVNEIDEDGSFDLAGQLAAAGMEQSSWEMLAGIALGILILCGLCWATARLSHRSFPVAFNPRIGSRPLLLLWLIVAIEKGSGFAWKSRDALRWEHSSFSIHLTPFKPAPGRVTFLVTWKDEKRPRITGQSEVQPDIFVIMVESLRYDAIAPPHASFLNDFKEHESQQVGQTWAASNSTHFSWYSFFNGQLPPRWQSALDSSRTDGHLPPSPLIELLQKNGYRLEVRTVSDLSYGGISSTNFGEPHVLNFQKDAKPGSEFHQLTIPRRELAHFADLKEQLPNQPKGRNFYFIALDSTHFIYTWDPGFEPPYDNWDNVTFHAFPSDDDIRRVKNRYLNSVAFVDSQIKNFIHGLRNQDRYDDALIIITGDHGEEFYEHGSWFHSSSLEDEQTAVPLLIKWPKGTSAPRHQSASHLDILPSLLDYFGEPEGSFAHLPGQSLLTKAQQEKTQIIMTSRTGVAGISMVWKRGFHTATFRWPEPWTNKLPGVLHLDDLTDSNGSLDLPEEEDWANALQEYFPDVGKRIFDSFETK